MRNPLECYQPLAEEDVCRWDWESEPRETQQFNNGKNDRFESDIGFSSEGF